MPDQGKKEIVDILWTVGWTARGPVFKFDVVTKP